LVGAVLLCVFGLLRLHYITLQIGAVQIGHSQFCGSFLRQTDGVSNRWVAAVREQYRPVTRR